MFAGVRVADRSVNICVHCLRKIPVASLLIMARYPSGEVLELSQLRSLSVRGLIRQVEEFSNKLPFHNTASEDLIKERLQQY